MKATTDTCNGMDTSQNIKWQKTDAKSTDYGVPFI